MKLTSIPAAMAGITPCCTPMNRCFSTGKSSAGNDGRTMGLKIVVIGAGNIGGALIGGILKSEVAVPGDVLAIDASDECRRRIADRWKVQVSPPGDPGVVR